MCLTPKVPVKNCSGKRSHTNPQCPYCSWSIVWRHTSYKRTGFHSREFENPPRAIIVLRCLCKNPLCGRTFGVLPSGTLPYCRFAFEDFLSISRRLLLGATPYSIWKSWPNSTVSLKAFAGLFSLIKRVMAFISAWVRETGLVVTGILEYMCRPLLEKVSWFTFTTRWYHALYPKRIWPFHNPHNLAP